MPRLNRSLARIGRIASCLLRRVFFLGPPPPPHPPARMSPEAVLSLAQAAMRTAGIGQGVTHSYGLAPSNPALVDGRIVWTVSTATIGSGWRVTVDDATGETGPVMRWGLR